MWRLLLGFGLSITAFAQGQVNFNTKVAASGVNAKIIMGPFAATTPPFAAGLALYTGDGTLTYIPGSATSFRAGPAAGYIQPVVVTIPGQDILTSVTLRMFAFPGRPTDAEALAALTSGAQAQLGMSNPVTVTLGGGTILPPDMIGLQGFSCAECPEPSMIAFGLLGAAALLFRRSPARHSVCRNS
jgi:uncharacterized protein (TIGR03382 family)